MSQYADLLESLCNGPVKEKLTIEERADLLIDILGSLEWDTFDFDGSKDYDKEMKRLKKQAIKELKNTEKYKNEQKEKR